MALTQNRDKYLSSVRPKQNREWFPEEKVAIFTMRQRGVSCAEIAKRFGVSLNQVHNATRYAKNEKLKKCTLCGEKLTSEDKADSKKRKICLKCFKKVQKNKRMRRKTRLAKGLCEYCGKNKVVPGHTGCKKCISATHRRRYNENLCGACGKNPIQKARISSAKPDDKPHALCNPCAKKMREKRLEQRKMERLEQKRIETFIPPQHRFLRGLIRKTLTRRTITKVSPLNRNRLRRVGHHASH